MFRDLSLREWAFAYEEVFLPSDEWADNPQQQCNQSSVTSCSASGPRAVVRDSADRYTNSKRSSPFGALPWKRRAVASQPLSLPKIRSRG